MTFAESLAESRAATHPETKSETKAKAHGDVVLMVGTVKGAFFIWSDAARTSWRIDGPHFPGESVYSLALDQRNGRHRLLAGTRSFHWGSVVRWSDDFGQSWTAPDRQNVKFPAGLGVSLVQVWQILPGRASQPDVIYAGVEPAALFESRDAGETWDMVRGLHDNEDRPKWQPGGGGLCLHTIVIDPNDAGRMAIAVSSGGFYRTDDGGNNWQARNVGVRAEFLPDKYPKFGQCVHKVVNHPARPERLFLQNHWGLYRSDNWGDSWTDIANDVPSDFGFSMQMHPHDPDTVYIVPIESDQFRCVPEAKLRVYRTTDAGASWKPLANGLPQKDAYETILRDALSADSLPSAGIYFGTRSGKLFGSANDGENWSEIAGGLPSIVCVKAAVVGTPIS
ncbi:MAG TPA: exo-alpha-sialidase [Gemmatimonadaceae bacterium]|nr:exo-alpha-sialidase [Gemmatimonadaceae bacterium]